MVTKVVIRDNQRSPIGYLPQVKIFRNKKTFLFKPGVNIIVGENGTGKSTLLKLIKRYLLIDNMECGRGQFNNNINALHKDPLKISSDDMELLDGVDVYADYVKNTFCLCHSGEVSTDDAMRTFRSFGALVKQKVSSKGEGVIVALDSLFQCMYSEGAKLTFDYSQFANYSPEYVEYVNSHRTEGVDEYTILMDEPDINLSIDNIEQIKSILSFHKPQTQIIAVVHNPLLIYYLSKKEEVNIIETSRGYVNKVKEFIKSIIE